VRDILYVQIKFFRFHVSPVGHEKHQRLGAEGWLCFVLIHHSLRLLALYPRCLARHFLRLVGHRTPRMSTFPPPWLSILLSSRTSFSHSRSTAPASAQSGSLPPHQPLATAGKRVAVVDKKDLLGGVCVHTGTIPSKTFRRVSSLSEVGYHTFRFGMAGRRRDDRVYSRRAFCSGTGGIGIALVLTAQA